MKKGVLKNFAKLTGKHLCQSFFFNKVALLKPATLLKKILWHRCFPVNFAKFLRTLFLQRTSGSLILNLEVRWKLKRQPSRGILIKRCSKNILQIYRRTLIPKCDFNKVAKQLYWNHTLAWCSAVNLRHIFRTPFPKNTSEKQLLKLNSTACKILANAKLYNWLFSYSFLWISRLFHIKTLTCLQIREMLWSYLKEVMFNI